MQKPTSAGRLAMRGRPPGSPVMHQRWENLLFLHWPLEPALLRALVPAPLEIDTFQDKAWIGITPFHLTDLHPANLPGFPGLKSFHELNVRTYVLHDGVPGIWFFSLDASKLIPAVAARALFMLPYFRASIRFIQSPPRFHFSLKRLGPPSAAFDASWRVTGVRLRDPAVDSLAFFLVERYCAFATENDSVFQIRIYHRPWILDEAQVQITKSSMISALGLPEAAGEPLAHFAASQDVEVWAPTRVSASNRKSQLAD